MHRAAARNAIDFKSADLMDRHFWRVLGFILRTIYEQELLELERLVYYRDLAVYNVAAIYQSKSDLPGKNVDGAIERIQDLLQPWAKDQRKHAVRDIVKIMEQDWMSIWGDPSDPEVAAKIAEVQRECGGG